MIRYLGVKIGGEAKGRSPQGYNFISSIGEARSRIARAKRARDMPEPRDALVGFPSPSTTTSLSTPPSSSSPPSALKSDDVSGIYPGCTSHLSATIRPSLPCRFAAAYRLQPVTRPFYHLHVQSRKRPMEVSSSHLLRLASTGAMTRRRSVLRRGLKASALNHTALFARYPGSPAGARSV